MKLRPEVKKALEEARALLLRTGGQMTLTTALTQACQAIDDSAQQQAVYNAAKQLVASLADYTPAQVEDQTFKDWVLTLTNREAAKALLDVLEGRRITRK